MAPSAAGAVPLFMDQRTLEQVAPAASAAATDRASEAAQKAAATLRGYEKKAQAALDAIQADPRADLNGYFGLAAGVEDNFMTALKSQDLGGPFAVPVGALRAAASAVDGVVPSGSKADSERVGRIMVTAWYKVVQDESFALPSEDKSNPFYEIKIQKRTNDDGPARLAKEIQAWLDALRVLRKFVE